jgi:predicted component of type VI protein secretion system
MKPEDILKKKTEIEVNLNRLKEEYQKLKLDLEAQGIEDFSNEVLEQKRLDIETELTDKLNELHGLLEEIKK